MERRPSKLWSGRLLPISLKRAAPTGVERPSSPAAMSVAPTCAEGVLIALEARGGICGSHRCALPTPRRANSPTSKLGFGQQMAGGSIAQYGRAHIALFAIPLARRHFKNQQSCDDLTLLCRSFAFKVPARFRCGACVSVFRLRQTEMISQGSTLILLPK